MDPPSAVTQRTIKRLVVLSDGSWQSQHNSTPTNIAQLAAAIAEHDAAGILQLVHYDAGIGSRGPIDSVLGGVFGAGVNSILRRLYMFVASHYRTGDELFLLGFSRGACVVRALAEMIFAVGLVRRVCPDLVRAACSLYRTSADPHGRKTTSFRRRHGERVPVKLLACFDTVCSIGLPASATMREGFHASFEEDCELHGTMLHANIEHAIHMLSIDEDRYAFRPTLMQANARVGAEQLTQLYFWGGHAGVGGGSPRQTDSSKLTLLFLVDEMGRRALQLELDRRKLPTTFDLLADVSGAPPVGLGALAAALGGRYVRPVTSLDEVHDAALRRYRLKRDWRPAALDPFRQEIVASSAQRAPPPFGYLPYR